MFFTDKFVFVHAPKTGGTFVTSAMFQLYGVEWTYAFRARHLLSDEVARRSPLGTFIYHRNKHGTCRQLPAAQRHKPILATVRNPFDLYVSQYEFGWWKRREYRKRFSDLPDFAARYPRFPDVLFGDFVALYNEAFPAPGSTAVPDGPVGKLTQDFVQYYFRDPLTVWPRLDELYIASGAWRRDAFDVHFVRTHRLNEELYEFLVGHGYRPREVEFIRAMGRVLPGGKGRSPVHRWERYYTPQLKADVRHRERLLFTLFPEFDGAPS